VKVYWGRVAASVLLGLVFAAMGAWAFSLI
jgi:hypothetical protein